MKETSLSAALFRRSVLAAGLGAPGGHSSLSLQHPVGPHAVSSGSECEHGLSYAQALISGTVGSHGLGRCAALDSAPRVFLKHGASMLSSESPP